MSADVFIAFYGIRFDVKENEIASLETKRHSHILNARKSGLDFYWGNFAEPGEKYYLFIGTKLGEFGFESFNELRLLDEDFNDIMNSTKSKLKEVGYSDIPALYLQFMPDA